MKVGSVVLLEMADSKQRFVEELEQGGRTIRGFHTKGISRSVASLGEMPLPPYIKERLEDKKALSNRLCERKWIYPAALQKLASLHFTEKN